MKLAYMDSPPGSNISAFVTAIPSMKVENVLDFSCNEEVVVASPHKSKDRQPAITVHYPGNPCLAAYGGKPKTLNITNPFLAHRIYISTLELLEKEGVEVPLTYEADHHGPTLDVPIIFYELGASNEMWESVPLAKLMAEALERALKRPDAPSSIFLAVGGNHYARKFNDLTIKKGFGYTHILAKHSLDCLEKGVFKQALERSLAVPEAVLVDWKGTTKEQREKISEWCDEFSIAFERA